MFQRIVATIDGITNFSFTVFVTTFDDGIDCGITASCIGMKNSQLYQA